jgi:hypothetical protein
VNLATRALLKRTQGRESNEKMRLTEQSFIDRPIRRRRGRRFLQSCGGWMHQLPVMIDPSPRFIFLQRASGPEAVWSAHMRQQTKDAAIFFDTAPL